MPIARKRTLLLPGLLFGLLLVLLLAFPRLARAQDIRVLLDSPTASDFTANAARGDYELLDSAGRRVAGISSGAKVEIESYSSGFTVYADGKLLAQGLPDFTLNAVNDDCLFTYQDKQYRGSLRVAPGGTATYIINNLDLEYYLYGVVGREIGSNQPLEALKAQAVASRSFALAKRNLANKYYDLGNDISAQLYGGYAAEQEAAASNVMRAVDATKGQVICYRGQPFESYFHSDAGGYTEDMTNVWGGNIPLKGVPSPYDDYVEKSGYSSSIYRWQVSYSAAELRDLAERYAGRSIGDYRSLELSTLAANGQPSASGRVMQATIKGSMGEVSAKGDAVRTLLGNLKSTLFSLDASASDVAAISSGTTLYVLDKGQTSPQPISDLGSCNVNDGSGVLSRLADWGLQFLIKGKDQSASYGGASSGSASSTSSSSGGVTLYGKGQGHGVGMSQWGAIGMAADGYTYDQILAHYYNMDSNRDFTLETYN